MTKHLLKLALPVVFLIATGLTTMARAQATGEFLCSTGSKDGQPCNSDDDCPGGVCVVSQGVCNGGTSNGDPCDCSGGTCATAPVCSTDATLGTCNGGIFNGECCDLSFNCSGTTACVATQKVCLGGTQKGFSCLNNGQCPGSTCASTGKFCDAGDFQDYTCVDDADCPNGSCVAQVTEPTPTPTRRPPTATATVVRTRTPTLAGPTRTRTPVTPGAPTNTPAPTQTPGAPTETPGVETPTPEASPTATVFTGSRLERDLSPAGVIIVLDDGSSLPGDRATVQIDDEQIFYLIRNGDTLESLIRGANGTTPASHGRGAPVILVEGLPTPTTRPKHTPTAGPASVVYQANGNGAGCTMTPHRDGTGAAAFGVAVALGLAWRRRAR